MNTKDLASAEHWSDRYKTLGLVRKGWAPADYNSLVLEKALKRALDFCQPNTIFEIGCGGSTWLPYLARLTNAEVAGMDYSELGCDLAKQRLEIEGVKGNIYCADLFSADIEKVGQYDFVFSLGVVEHFTDTESTLLALLCYVKPGGVLFTEMPNMMSIHGLLSWIWQPQVLYKHKVITKKRLESAYTNVGINSVCANYAGIFSLDIVAWGIEPRWPRLEKIMLPFIRRTIRLLDKILRRLIHYEWNTLIFSPFIYIFGEKPTESKSE